MSVSIRKVEHQIADFFSTIFTHLKNRLSWYYIVRVTSYPWIIQAWEGGRVRGWEGRFPQLPPSLHPLAGCGRWDMLWPGNYTVWTPAPALHTTFYCLSLFHQLKTDDMYLDLTETKDIREIFFWFPLESRIEFDSMTWLVTWGIKTHASSVLWISRTYFVPRYHEIVGQNKNICILLLIFSSGNFQTNNIKPVTLKRWQSKIGVTDIRHYVVKNIKQSLQYIPIV